MSIATTRRIAKNVTHQIPQLLFDSFTGEWEKHSGCEHNFCRLLIASDESNQKTQRNQNHADNIAQYLGANEPQALSLQRVVASLRAGIRKIVLIVDARRAKLGEASDVWTFFLFKKKEEFYPMECFPENKY